MARVICSRYRNRRCGYKCFRMGAEQKHKEPNGTGECNEESSCLLSSSALTLFVRFNATSVGNCLFSIVSNKISVGSELGQNSRRSQGAPRLEKRSLFVISVNQEVPRLGKDEADPARSLQAGLLNTSKPTYCVIWSVRGNQTTAMPSCEK